MKLRTSLVSNSSSSSFIAITSDWPLTEVFEAHGFGENPDWDDLEKLSGGWGGVYELRGGLSLFYNGYDSKVGLEIEKLLETMTIPQCRQEFKQRLKRHYNITVPDKMVRFSYGEWSSE
jgi:hypothetical protein